MLRSTSRRLERLAALAGGGPRFHAIAESVLPKRPVEPSDIYAERIKLTTYTPHSGSMVQTLAAMLFAEPAQVEATADTAWWSTFLEQVDRRRGS